MKAIDAFIKTQEAINEMLSNGYNKLAKSKNEEQGQFWRGYNAALHTLLVKIPMLEEIDELKEE